LGQSEFRLAFDSSQVIAPDVNWLLNFLSKNVAAGARYKHGELIQIGWIILKVQTNEEGTLSLLEPDFLEIPINFVDSVTQTLVQLRLQKSVAESIGFEDQITFPSLRQSCLICSRVKDRGDFVMEHFEAHKNDSGWYMGCVDADHNHNNPQNLKRVSLYDAACGMLMCVPFLPLPQGVLVQIKGGGFSIAYNGKTLRPKTNSFMQQYLLKHSKRDQRNQQGE
jgi:hypothetical protein